MYTWLILIYSGKVSTYFKVKNVSYSFYKCSLGVSFLLSFLFHFPLFSAFLPVLNQFHVPPNETYVVAEDRMRLRTNFSPYPQPFACRGKYWIEDDGERGRGREAKPWRCREIAGVTSHRSSVFISFNLATRARERGRRRARGRERTDKTDGSVRAGTRNNLRYSGTFLITADLNYDVRFDSRPSVRVSSRFSL